MRENIPDKDLFMMCGALNAAALSPVPFPYTIRKLRKDEFDQWKALHIDAPEEAAEYDQALTDFYNRVYAPHGDLFFEKCLVICDAADTPVGTCFIWHAYGGQVPTLHWLKVQKAYEGRGLGRALLSAVMSGLGAGEYPVFLHTHPSCYRAIKLYADFGFTFLTDVKIGNRPNDIAECLPLLRRLMPEGAYRLLKTTGAPQGFLSVVNGSAVDEF